MEIVTSLCFESRAMATSNVIKGTYTVANQKLQIQAAQMSVHALLPSLDWISCIA